MAINYKGTNITNLVYKDPKTNNNVNTTKGFKWKESEKRYVKVFELKDKPAGATARPRIYVTWQYNKIPGYPGFPDQYQVSTLIEVTDRGNTYWGESFDISLAVSYASFSTTLNYNNHATGGVLSPSFSGSKPSSTGTVTVKCSNGDSDSFYVYESGGGYSKRFEIPLPVAPKIYHPVVESKIGLTPEYGAPPGYWDAESTFVLKNTGDVSIPNDLYFDPFFNGEEMPRISIDTPFVSKRFYSLYFPGTDPGNPPNTSFDIKVTGMLYPSKQTKTISQKINGRYSEEAITFDLEGPYYEDTEVITLETIFKTIKDPAYPNNNDKWLTNIESRLVAGFDWPRNITVRVANKTITKTSPVVYFEYHDTSTSIPETTLDIEIDVGTVIATGYKVSGTNDDKLTQFILAKP